MVSKHNLTELKFLVDFNGELLWKVELVIAKGCALLIATIFKLAANKLQINPKHKITYLEIVQALSCQKLRYCWRGSIAMSTNEMLQRGEGATGDVKKWDDAEGGLLQHNIKKWDNIAEGVAEEGCCSMT